MIRFKLQMVEFNLQGKGLNRRLDIEVDSFEIVPRSFWDGMQIAAEEKDKGYIWLFLCSYTFILTFTYVCINPSFLILCPRYRCIIYSEKPIRRQDLQMLESQAAPTLTLQQKTPLRVLHRWVKCILSYHSCMKYIRISWSNYNNLRITRWQECI